jgi:hypothetical protein
MKEKRISAAASQHRHCRSLQGGSYGLTEGASSTTIKRSILTWNFSWHYGGMKEDTLQKGLPVPDEAAVRERVLRKNVEAPDLTTVKDFLRFHAPRVMAKFRNRWLATRSTRLRSDFSPASAVPWTYRQMTTSEGKSTKHLLPSVESPDLTLTSGSGKSCLRKASWLISGG